MEKQDAMHCHTSLQPENRLNQENADSEDGRGLGIQTGLRKDFLIGLHFSKGHLLDNRVRC